MRNCCNPYRVKHTSKQNRNTQNVTDSEKSKILQVFPNFCFPEEAFICVNCQMKISKAVSLLKVVKEGIKRAQRAKERSKQDKSLSSQSNVTTRQDSPEPGPSSKVQPTSPGENADDDSLDDAAQFRLYPTLPPIAEESEIARQLPFNPDVEPSAPIDEDLPGSSNQARDGLLKRKIDTTPTRSLTTSSETGSNGSNHGISGSSGDSDTVNRSMVLNKAMQDTTLGPVQPSDIRRPRRLRRKWQKWRKQASDAFLRATGYQSTPQTRKGKNCPFCNKLFSELSEKFKVQTSKSDQYKILTSIPKRFSIQEVENRTGCSHYMAKQASALKNVEGAFSSPQPKLGKPMDPEHVELITNYYTADENSRASPNETLFVKNSEGQRVKVEKRRIMHNLNDLYQLFLKENPQVKVSLSKFCKLRPKNCIWPGLKGQHVTCVCETHQNFEFLLDATESGLNISEFVKKTVCEAPDGELNGDCYLGLCSACPNKDFLEETLKNVKQEDEVCFMQWMRTDSTEIKNVTLSTDDYLKKFLDYVPRILEHQYINKKQSMYFKQLRETIIKESNAVTIQVDFAQNYNFVVQNAVQGFHWSNRQATIHPFAVHWFDPEKNKIQYKTFCVVSDQLTHDADTFHVFRNAVIPMIKDHLKSIPFQKIYYISDGCAGQYKGVKNFANLMLHKEDHGIDAEWHFCATSHGKGVCDGISAVVKCSARRQSIIKGDIITEANTLFDYCKDNLTSPTLGFVYITKEEVSAQKPMLAERYKPFKTIQGTRKHHVFIPKPNGVMLMGRTSDSVLFTEVDFRTTEIGIFSSANVTLGSFCAFFEAGNYHVGLVVEEDAEEGDVKLQLLKFNRNTRKAIWPDPLAFTDVAYRDILLTLKEPATTDGNSYIVDKVDMSNIKKQFVQRKTQLSGK